jgi:DNA replication protein DnaC
MSFKRGTPIHDENPSSFPDGKKRSVKRKPRPIYKKKESSIFPIVLHSTTTPSSSSIIPYHNRHLTPPSTPKLPFFIYPNRDNINKTFLTLMNDILVKNELSKEEEKKDEPPTSAQFHCNTELPVNEIEYDINSLEALIELGNLFNDVDFGNYNYSINIEGLHKMKSALQQLNNMIGLQKIKEQILEHIMYFSQELHYRGQEEKKEDLLNQDSTTDMYHTVIYGPPGVGKTIFAKILARIYLSLGITTKNVFVVARRCDLIGEYLGQTAVKTQKKINEAMGGVLFIDEVYSLGATSEHKNSDSFSKECIDTINLNLTEHKGKFICIIAGYKDEIEKHFFKINPGLKRRFSFTYTIDGYSSQELSQILLLKLSKIEWVIDEGCKYMLLNGDFFKNKMDKFPYFAGDIETFVLHIKIAHGRRVFGKHPALHKVIMEKDIDNGYQRYLSFRGLDSVRNPYDSMYL